MKSTNRKIIALQLILFINLTCLAQANYQEALKTGAIESVWQGLNDSLNSAGFSNFFIAAGLQKGKSHNTNWNDP